jgi:hypothetical protein
VESDTFPPVQPPTILPIPGYTPAQPLQQQQHSVAAVQDSLPAADIIIQHSDIIVSPLNGPVAASQTAADPIFSVNNAVAAANSTRRGETCPEPVVTVAAASNSACDIVPSRESVREEKVVQQTAAAAASLAPAERARRSSSPAVILLGKFFPYRFH